MVIVAPNHIATINLKPKWDFRKQLTKIITNQENLDKTTVTQKQDGTELNQENGYNTSDSNSKSH